jgi:hypothetical protein
MKQQTAVEWLECELKKIPFINVIEVFEQAKAKEKEQIIDAYCEGFKDGSEGGIILCDEYLGKIYNQDRELPKDVTDLLENYKRNNNNRYLIFDCNGMTFPNHYSNRNRTYEEAKKLIDKLNVNGEFRPYTMKKVQ